MKTKRILILEDDLKTISMTLSGLHKLEEELFKKDIDLSIMLMSEQALHA